MSDERGVLESRSQVQKVPKLTSIQPLFRVYKGLVVVLRGGGERTL